MVPDPKALSSTDVGLSARASSADQKQDLDRLMDRLKDDAAAQGYRATRQVSERGSGLNDRRPRFL